MPRPTPLVVVLLLLLSLAPLRAHSPGAAVQEMTDAANAWVASLSAEQQVIGLIEFTKDERENWHYIPKPREGLPLAKMDENQRKLARALLASGLSQHGLLEAESVMALERVLRAIENSDRRDETLYYFTVFGKPSDHGTWAWRVEGHHLSVNFTLVDGRISATPNFVGSNPAEVRLPGPDAGKRILAAEEDLGRAFVTALDAAQRGKAVVSDKAPGDILTRNDRQAKSPGPEGIGYAALTPAQQVKFKELVALYANRLRHEVAEAELKKIADSGWERLSFAWAGSLKRGEGHYYRIQSPDFVIEYDNTQNNANHVHTVWRVYAEDFGRDLLQEHYRTAHSDK
jgi:hypothetical protein